MEYRARLRALVSFAEQENIPLIIDGEYGVRPFTKAVGAHPENRCRECYCMRLAAAAEYAKNNGFDAFSTTLFISPYQDQKLMQETGEEMAEKYGIPFRFWDFRPNYHAGQEMIRSRELYMQKYCGCIYSEEERYENQRKKLKQGFFPNFPAASL